MPVSMPSRSTTSKLGQALAASSLCPTMRTSGNLRWKSFTSVSYTHLDVYKRQGWPSGSPCPRVGLPPGTRRIPSRCPCRSCIYCRKFFFKGLHAVILIMIIPVSSSLICSVFIKFSAYKCILDFSNLTFQSASVIS